MRIASRVVLLLDKVPMKVKSSTVQYQKANAVKKNELEAMNKDLHILKKKLIIEVKQCVHTARGGATGWPRWAAAHPGILHQPVYLCN